MINYLMNNYNLKMGTTANIFASKKGLGIIYYYLFHKKIENFIKKGISPLIKNNNLIYIYLINPKWIKAWKSINNYDNIKLQFDSIKENNDNLLLNKLKILLNKLIQGKKIDIEKNENPPNEDNIEFEKIFFGLNFLKDEVFDYLIDYDTYKLLFNNLNPLNYFNSSFIKGLIKDKMIILMMDKKNKIKFIYNDIIGNNKNNIIQITSNFYEENKYKTFCDELVNKNIDNIIKIFNDNDIRNNKEIIIKDNNIKNYYILKNENLFKKYYNEKFKNNYFQNINFNMNNQNLICLKNIDNPPYLNSVIQNLINIDPLIKYFLNEANYKTLNNNSDLCNFTCHFCEILSEIYSNNEIKSYDLNEFNEIIYLKDSKFRFNEYSLPGDLIKFILDTINSEFIQMLKIKNDNIIFNTFNYKKQTKMECESCKNLMINSFDSFLLEFSLDVIYNHYSQNKNIKKDKDGKIIINIEQCFDFYFNEHIKLECEKCKKKCKLQNKLSFLPEILIIEFNKKIFENNYIFSFTEEIDLKKYVTNELKDKNYSYQLRGTIFHNYYNDTKLKYISYCKNRTNNKWLFNDDLNSIYCSFELNKTLSEKPDVLIYESINKF